jgi:hypothetical protein
MRNASDNQNPVQIAMTGFEPAMARVRDLERVGEYEEARKLFEPMVGVVAKALRDQPQGFPILVKAYGEASRRQ